MLLLEQPIGILHFGMLCGATLLFMHQGLVNLLLWGSGDVTRYRQQAMLCFSSSAFALANILGYLPMEVVLKVQILQLQWICAIWVVITYVQALEAYLDMKSIGLDRVVLTCKVLILIPIAGVLSLAVSGDTFFYELSPQPTAGFIWEATGNVASYSLWTHAFVAMTFLTMCVILVLILREILGRPQPDRFLIVGVCFTAVAATTEGMVGGLGLNAGLPVFYLANAVEILRITYMSTLQAGSEASLLQRRQEEQRQTIERQVELLQASAKWAEVGQVMGGIGHEIRSPLAAAHSWLQVATGRIKDGDPLLAQPLTRAREALEHLDGIVDGLGTISRDERGEDLTSVSLPEAVDHAMALCSHRLKRIDCEPTIDVADGLRVRGRASELVQVLLNLLSNACDAIEAIDAPWIRVHAATGADGGVRLQISDCGPPPPASVRERMFRPFYTTKPQGAGTGIGLSICRQIVEDYGGTIELLDSDHTVFAIDLPSSRISSIPPLAPTP